MVVAIFPLSKIGLLFLKQLSKPLANIIKNEAKKHPLIRKHVIVPLGRGYNWTESKINLKGGKEEKVSEEELVELGANAVGEIILFSFLTLILLAEMSRQGDKKAAVEKLKAEEMTNLQDVVLELHNEISDLKNEVQILRKKLEVPPDLLELEEMRHVQIPDREFWDIMNAHDAKSKSIQLKVPFH